jgi:hypothetical protein
MALTPVGADHPGAQVDVHEGDAGPQRAEYGFEERGSDVYGIHRSERQHRTGHTHRTVVGEFEERRDGARPQRGCVSVDDESGSAVL